VQQRDSAQRLEFLSFAAVQALKKNNALSKLGTYNIYSNSNRMMDFSIRTICTISATIVFLG